ncbi:MAG: NADH-quinone oxidoreductase subunit NuoG [Chloroflexota bacterium]|nr:NADH-quinone oxidoreductase subunit NuoG [Chloroflexota bacterium]
MPNVKIYIDEHEYEVPAGSNLVDVAKFHADNDIPVFCYHPKMKPVGMCRMCLVEMGTIEKDKATGEVLRDEAGKAKIRWMPKLQTACTQTVYDGLCVRTGTPQVADARKNVVEFILTSHPLDCPICDKGGECPLQNLTMEHGPGTSRMNFDDKLHLDKHVPLGDLIFLDEERCIQCGRCVRYQDEVVGDPVLAFHERGRSLQIITVGDPAFDTYFSGNTTDICPVGALTSGDFRFGARPWELTNIPSIDPFDAAGSNITLCVRLDREFGGRAMIKRVMARQNEAVNEIWISDKARFGHHFTRAADRLQQSMVRKGDSLSAASWNDALALAADKIKAAGGSVAAIAGPMMSNEDLWSLRQLVKGAGSERLGAWPPTHAGADLVAQVGVGTGTNLGELGKGDAVLIIASDLEEEVPIWRHRLKVAKDRGALLVTANARPTRMDYFANECLHYETGSAAQFMNELAGMDIGKQLAGANNLIIVAGAEGLTLEGSRALMQAAANFLINSGHVGKANNGLMATLPGANGMGLHYMGFSPEATMDIVNNPPKVLIIAQADVMADDPHAAAWLSKVDTIISLSLFPDGATQRAAVALPVQSFAERDGTYTSGDRRVQRFYTAQGPMGEALPAWQAIQRLGEKLGQGRPKTSAAATMMEITQQVPGWEGCRYPELAKVSKQFPDVGGNDLYYGGTSYKNTGGLGVQIASAAEKGAVSEGKVNLPAKLSGGMIGIPVTRLYNRERVFRPSEAEFMGGRVAQSFVELNVIDAKNMGIKTGDTVQVTVNGSTALRARANVGGNAPSGTVIIPRHLTEVAIPLAPVAVVVTKEG